MTVKTSDRPTSRGVRPRSESQYPREDPKRKLKKKFIEVEVIASLRLESWQTHEPPRTFAKICGTTSANVTPANITTTTSEDIDDTRQDACTYSPTPEILTKILMSMGTVPQDLPHEAEAREGAEAEQTHPTVDSPEDRQHHQVCIPCKPSQRRQSMWKGSEY